LLNKIGLIALALLVPSFVFHDVDVDLFLVVLGSGARMAFVRSSGPPRAPERCYRRIIGERNMGFLDSLVSDLIRGSTGFNVKPFVRAVGGKNILLLGGAAIAGALAAEKMRGGQTAPPLPPLPGEATPPLPPLPVPAVPEPQLPQPLLFAIVRTLVAGALADGQMHAEEKKLIEKHLGESGLSPDQVSQIHKDLVIPASPDELARSASMAEDRELLYRFGALVVLAEGDCSAPERAWLDRFGSALGLAEDRRQALETEIFGTT
jgi:uncharacterized membrane protein YebE (DUF533 family)